MQTVMYTRVKFGLSAGYSSTRYTIGLTNPSALARRSGVVAALRRAVERGRGGLPVPSASSILRAFFYCVAGIGKPLQLFRAALLFRKNAQKNRPTQLRVERSVI